MAETSLLAGLRPLIMQSAPDDRTLDAGFMDNITVHVPGGGAGVEIVNGSVYIAISLRNQGGRVEPHFEDAGFQAAIHFPPPPPRPAGPA